VVKNEGFVAWMVTLMLIALVASYHIGRMAGEANARCTRDHAVEPSHMAVPTLDHKEAPQEQGVKA